MAYDTYKSKYILVVSQYDSGSPNLYITTSTDGITWGTRVQLESETGESFYPTIGLKPEEFAKINSLKQLRPLVDNQPWGIFSVDFESKRLEISALRRILHKLVPLRSNSDYKTWKYDHLLFLCFWGDSAYRTIGFIAFEENAGALPLIKPLYCTPKIEDRSHLETFEARVNALHWSSDINSKEWIAEWRRAFVPAKGQIIQDTQHLTEILAAKALNIASLLNRAC